MSVAEPPPVEVTRRANLMKLADLLDGPNKPKAKDFSMAHWSMCAFGHAVRHEIGRARPEEHFLNGFIGQLQGDSRRWLFGSDWAGRDNTPEGAAARIRYYLKHGAPQDEAMTRYRTPDWELLGLNSRGRIKREYRHGTVCA